MNDDFVEIFMKKIYIFEFNTSKRINNYKIKALHKKFLHELTELRS